MKNCKYKYTVEVDKNKIYDLKVDKLNLKNIKNDITISELQNIFEYYKKEYKLNTRLDIVEVVHNCYYNTRSDYILLGIEFIKKHTNNQYLLNKFNISNTRELAIVCLLHEIKHSIDYNYNEEQFKEELLNINIGLYKSDLQYHDKQPFEKRADKFAISELKKWIDKKKE